MPCKVCGATKGPFYPVYDISPTLSWSKFNGWEKREYVCPSLDAAHLNALRGIKNKEDHPEQSKTAIE